jgi:SAM-dependent methyltransferase
MRARRLTAGWMPGFVCPECRIALAEEGRTRMACMRCARIFEQRDRVWRFLAPHREAQLEPFARQYRLVREREGRHHVSPAYYRMLPNVTADDPQARDWRIRQETYRHLLGHVLAGCEQPSSVLDLGAGNAWLSHRLAALGHHVVAVDAIEDDADGLGVVRHYETPIVAVQADFDALPLAAGQFDVVVFNGSLHYAPDPAATLAHARAMLNGTGTLVVMDSPMFVDDSDGAAMVADGVRRLAHEFGLYEAAPAGRGYLTFSALDATASRLRLASEFVPSRGPLAWRMRRQLARVRLGRQPAAFGLWVAR